MPILPPTLFVLSLSRSLALSLSVSVSLFLSLTITLGLVTAEAGSQVKAEIRPQAQMQEGIQGQA